MYSHNKVVILDTQVGLPITEMDDMSTATWYHKLLYFDDVEDAQRYVEEELLPHEKNAHERYKPIGARISVEPLSS